MRSRWLLMFAVVVFLTGTAISVSCPKVYAQDAEDENEGEDEADEGDTVTRRDSTADHKKDTRDEYRHRQDIKEAGHESTDDHKKDIRDEKQDENEHRDIVHDSTDDHKKDVRDKKHEGATRESLKAKMEKVKELAGDRDSERLRKLNQLVQEAIEDDDLEGADELMDQAIEMFENR